MEIEGKERLFLVRGTATTSKWKQLKVLAWEELGHVKM